ncbi:MAG: MgtC/SapB family protein [Pseudomonadales bacterium]
MIDDLDPRILDLALAVALGFLVGLERERAPDKLIGLRSFALIGAFGGLAGLLAADWGGWVAGVGLAALTAMILAHRLRLPAREPDREFGTTTMVAAAIVFLLGAACVAGYRVHAVVLGGLTIILLHWKQPLHGLAARLGNEEFNAIARFVLITLVVLPVLPNASYGPYAVFNPFHTWLLVVLIVALNLVGYVALRLLGSRRGAILGGVLGGMVSSTATTVSFAGLARDDRAAAPGAALIILIASTVVYARIGIELAVVAPGLLAAAAGPLLAFTVLMLAASAAVYPRVSRQSVTLPAQSNPARLQVALTFGVLYVVILFTLAAARDWIGDHALYAVAFVSGLTDVDAMTLSVGRLYAQGDLAADVAWRAVFLASLANLLFKVGAGCVIGGPALRRFLLPAGAATLAGGLAVLLFWP